MKNRSAKLRIHVPPDKTVVPSASSTKRNPWLVDSAIVERGVSASMGHRRVGGESNDDIGRLRRRASAMGVSIRTERANRTSEQRAYSLVYRTSGNVLHGGI